MPEHVYWSPTGTPAGPRPRFFWKDERGTYRAIGPGKPADDLALFNVKTAMGSYREPRHGEDITGHAHAAKVKVRAGFGPDAWDAVVHMTGRP